MDKVGKILAQVMPRENRLHARTDQTLPDSKQQTLTQLKAGNRGHSTQSHERGAQSPHTNNAYKGAQQLANAARKDAHQEQTAKSPQNTDVPVARASDRSSDRTLDRTVPPRRRRMGVNTDLTRVKGILSKVLSYRGLDKKVERYEFILHWPAIVGERLAEVTKPECIRNRALIVKVAHPVWAQELVMMKPVILQSLARYLKPGDIVHDIVCRAGDAEEIGR